MKKWYKIIIILIPLLQISFSFLPKNFSSKVWNNNSNSLRKEFLFTKLYIYFVYTSSSFFNNFFSLPCQIGCSIEKTILMKKILSIFVSTVCNSLIGFGSYFPSFLLNKIYFKSFFITLFISFSFNSKNFSWYFKL